MSRPAPIASGVDARILALAADQHGVVARHQLLGAGITRHRIDYRIKCGRMVPLGRGVYRVGPMAAPREKEMAAILACGAGAVISHRSGAVLWELVTSRGQAAGPVHVSVRRGCPSSGPGIHVHRCGSLNESEVTTVDGLPVTTPARTLLDLAGCAGPREVERAVARALRERVVEREDLDGMLARHPTLRGTGRLRALLSEQGGPALTRSEAEARFLALIRKGGLRGPEVNVVVRGLEVDFLWRTERLVAEVDGYAYHSTKDAFERDRTRDGVLAAAGFTVVRVTWRKLVNEPEALLVGLAQALARSGSGGG